MQNDHEKRARLVSPIEVEGERCHRVLRCATTYTSAACTAALSI